MRPPVPHIVLVIALAALAACHQDPDVGQPCTLQWGTDLGTPPPNPVELFNEGRSDFFESGNVSCENLVCIVSPVPAGARYSSGGYCSKPCVSNSDCFESETKLVCRQMVLDPVFLEQLSPDLAARYLGEVRFSSYCAVP